MADRYTCVTCRKVVTKTKNDRYRSHSDGDGEPCRMSSEPIPEHVLAQPTGKDDAPDVPREGIDYATCPHCERKVKLTALGYFQPHNETLTGGDRCPVSGVRAKHARRQEDVLLPGDEKPGSVVPKVSAQQEITSPARTSTNAGAGDTRTEPLPSGGEINWDDVGPLTHPGAAQAAELKERPALPAGSSAITDSNSPESTSTSSDSPGPPPVSPSPSTSSDAEEEPADAGPFHLAPLLDEKILQPFSHFFQPFPVPPRIRLAEAMSDEGKELAARLRETFYAYTNRNARDNRSAQKTLGPSEIGSPCDRQIAMKLLGVRPVNPQEGWAPFVGTAVHVELAKMFEWANGSGSGRYIAEMPVQIGSELVPHGTLDVYDGVLYLVGDNKLMGRYSLDKLIQNGPSETYRVQLHTYGLGVERAGFKVRKVALIAWPRQESSLDKLYVHVEPYDRKVALAAIERVERIAREVREIRRPDGLGQTPGEMATAQQFDAGDDCKWCSFHLKNDKGFTRGCPGK